MFKAEKKTVWLACLFIASCLGIVIFLWWLVGLKNTDVAEGWLFLINSQKSDFFVFHGRGRPLLQIVTLLSFRATPNSFVGMNLAFAMSFVVRGIMVYLFTKRYTKDALLAVAAGFFSMVFTVDASHMTLRLINLFWIFNWVMIAIWLYNIGMNKQKPLMMLLGLLFLTIACLGRETSFPFFYAAPILFFLDNKNPIRSRLKGIGLWLLFTTAYFLYFIYNILFGTSGHQTDAIALDNLFRASEIFSEAMYTYFYGYWERILDTDYWVSIITAATGIGVISFLCMIVFAHYDRAKTSWFQIVRHFLVVLALGLSTIFLGLILYIPTDRIDLLGRIHMIPTIGAAIIILMALRFLLRPLPFSKQLFALAAAFIIGFSSLDAIEQHISYARISRNMQYIMAQIVSQVPDVEESAQAIVVFDTTERLQARDVFVDSRRIMGFSRGLYANNSLDAFFCSVTEVRGRLRNPCTFTETTVTNPYGVEYNISQIIAFEVVEPNYQLILLEEIPTAYLNGIESLSTYNPHENICEECPLSSGTERLFYDWPFPTERAPISGQMRLE